MCVTIDSSEGDNCIDSLVNRISSQLRLERTMAWCLRFIHNCRNKSDKRSGELSIAEMDRGLATCIKRAQEIAQLKNNGVCEFKTETINSIRRYKQGWFAANCWSTEKRADWLRFATSNIVASWSADHRHYYLEPSLSTWTLENQAAAKLAPTDILDIVWSASDKKKTSKSLRSMQNAEMRKM